MDRQAGSFIQKDGKIEPNLKDEAMKNRMENQKKEEIKKNVKRQNSSSGKD